MHKSKCLQIQIKFAQQFSTPKISQQLQCHFKLFKRWHFVVAAVFLPLLLVFSYVKCMQNKCNKSIILSNDFFHRSQSGWIEWKELVDLFASCVIALVALMVASKGIRFIIYLLKLFGAHATSKVYARIACHLPDEQIISE